MTRGPTVALRVVRRVAVSVVGGSVPAFGVALLVLPGPAIVVIPAGLGILATEFLWARRLLQRLRGESGSRWRSCFGSACSSPSPGSWVSQPR